MTQPAASRVRRLGLNLLALGGGLLAALVLLEILLGFLPPDRLYRSPDDRLATFDYRWGHGKYKPRQQGEMFIPFGDMVVFDHKARAFIAEPRRVRYRTDSAGFRNDADYHNEPYLLVGDSFIAGSGLTQEDLLSAQLRRDYGIAAYNLAFPGGLHNYVHYVEAFFKTHPRNCQVLIFLFEGNDFPLQRTQAAAPAKEPGGPPSALRLARKELQQSLRELLVYRYAFSLGHLLMKRVRPEKYPAITVARLRGQDQLYLGFLNNYVEVTRRTSYQGGAEFGEKLARIKDQVAGLFFIPTKFRVYYPLLDGEPASPLPHAQWDYVKAQADRLGIRCVDLTGPLRDESRRLRPEGKLTFWKDDSHWNRYGVAVAARTVRNFLETL